MSATMVVATTTTTTLLADRTSPSCCPSCGYTISLDDEPPSTQLLEAQARIAELETQVGILNQKASAAVDRWAEYEAELSKLRSQQHFSPSQHLLERPSSSQSPTRPSFFQAGATRLSALVYSRRSPSSSPAALPVPPTTPPPNPNAQAAAVAAAAAAQQPHPASPSAEDLLEALTREQTLRRAAEGRLSATSKEVEELSVALFEQANEMVADERRARAKLEQRVDELEKRDADKKKRLDRLEMAMDRIERVRNLLQETIDVAPRPRPPPPTETKEQS